MPVKDDKDKSITPTAGVIGVVRKLLDINIKIDAQIKKIDGDPTLEAFKGSAEFNELKQMSGNLDHELDDLLDALSALFDDYTSLLNKNRVKDLDPE